VPAGRGLAKIESPDGTIVSYSTQAGRTAVDGTGRNSPYTSAFLRHIEDKDDIATVFHHISANVYGTTRGTQVPELSLSFFGEFYLNGPLQINVGPTTPTAPPVTESGAVTVRAEHIGEHAAACGVDRTSRAPWQFGAHEVTPATCGRSIYLPSQ
jgi:hypothetical protein